MFWNPLPCGILGASLSVMKICKTSQSDGIKPRIANLYPLQAYTLT